MCWEKHLRCTRSCLSVAVRVSRKTEAERAHGRVTRELNAMMKEKSALEDETQCKDIAKVDSASVLEVRAHPSACVHACMLRLVCACKLVHAFMHRCVRACVGMYRTFSAANGEG